MARARKHPNAVLQKDFILTISFRDSEAESWVAALRLPRLRIDPNDTLVMAE
jgi:hypothetical protein